MSTFWPCRRKAERPISAKQCRSGTATCLTRGVGRSSLRRSCARTQVQVRMGFNPSSLLPIDGPETPNLLLGN